MESNIFYFYFLCVIILGSAAGIILAPRMYIAVISLFGLICSSGLLYLSLNAKYMAIFQFILCGIFLCGYVFILLKKINRLNLKLKLVNPIKIIFSSLWVLLFGVLTCLFFNEEFNNSLYSIFNFIIEKSSDTVKFAEHIFPLHLVILLVFVAAIILRIFLSSPVVSQNEEQK